MMASNGSTCNSPGEGSAVSFAAFRPLASDDAGTLNDKHVVLIEMRADAAAGTEKEIIRSSIRQSGSSRNGALARRSAHASGSLLALTMTISFTEMIVAFEWTVADLPFAS